MHTHPSAHISRQHLRPPSLPLACKKTVLKRLKQVALEVVAAVGTYPGPTGQGIEVPVGTIKGGINRFGHRGASSVGKIAQQPEALKALVLLAGLNGKELKATGLLSGGSKSGSRHLCLLSRQVGE